MDIETSWADWLDRWDVQQTAYIRARERRFDVMFELLEALAPPEPTVLDLASGPGPLSRRLLRRVPRSRSVAVDVDPVLLELGRRAQGDHGGRLRWARADLNAPNWTGALGEERFDAVLSTTALHWLSADVLVRVYRELAALLPRGGVFLNGDLLPMPPHLATIREAIARVDHRREKFSHRAGAESWDQWWDALRAEPSLQADFAEKDRTFSKSQASSRTPGAAFHETALTEAGFREVAVVWQDLEERVMLAIR